MKLKNIHSLKLLPILLLAILFVSCKKDSSDTTFGGTNLLVNVKVVETTYEDLGSVSNSTTTNLASLNSVKGTVQTEVVEFSDDIMMVSELELVNDSKSGVSSDIIKKGSNRAATTVRIPLDESALYKVVVFKKEGAYVTERDYVHKHEQDAEPLLLDGGDYTFIAYSLNSTSVLPVLSYYDGNSANKDISNIYINALDVQDILFEKKDMNLHVDKNNNLDLVLRHKFNHITTVIDVTQTKYEITSLSAYLSPIYPNAEIKFSDVSINRTGTPGSVPLIFKGLENPSSILEAEGVVINAPSDVNLLTITSLTVGPFASDYQTPFKNLKMIPGARYKLMVRLVPKDKYIDSYNGHPVVMINGVYWMRHNLGADPTVIDVTTSVEKAQHGNFYQWGREYPLAPGDSKYPANSAPTSWEPYVNLVSSAWYKGTVEKPEKGDRDPCPVGFRIPSMAELDSLKNGTEAFIVGNWDRNEENYGAGVLFRSIRNRDVFITLPAQGAYAPSGIDGEGLPGGKPFNFGGLVFRAQWAAYWASYLDIDGENANKGLVGRLRVTSFNNNARVEVDYRKPASTENTVGAYPIRCVAIVK